MTGTCFTGSAGPLETQRATDCVWIGAEAADPERVADQRHHGPPAHVVLRDEVTPSGNPYAKHAKKVGFHSGARQRLGLLVGDTARPGTGRCGHGFERRRRCVPYLHVASVLHPQRGRFARVRDQQPDRDESIGLGVRQRPEQHGVERGEERRRGAEAESQHEDGRQRERGPASPRPPGEVRVLSQRIPPLGDPDAAHRLARLQRVAQPSPRRRVVQAIVLGAHRHVRLELLPHLVVGWSSAEPARQAHRSPTNPPAAPQQDRRARREPRAAPPRPAARHPTPRTRRPRRRDRLRRLRTTAIRLPE